MGDIDEHILHELQLDGRLSDQDLADRVGLSPSPGLRRVRLLEQRGLVTGCTAVVPALGTTTAPSPPPAA